MRVENGPVAIQEFELLREEGRGSQSDGDDCATEKAGQGAGRGPGGPPYCFKPRPYLTWRARVLRLGWLH